MNRIQPVACGGCKGTIGRPGVCSPNRCKKAECGLSIRVWPQIACAGVAVQEAELKANIVTSWSVVVNSSTFNNKHNCKNHSNSKNFATAHAEADCAVGMQLSFPHGAA